MSHCVRSPTTNHSAGRRHGAHLRLYALTDRHRCAGMRGSIKLFTRPPGVPWVEGGCTPARPSTPCCTPPARPGRAMGSKSSVMTACGTDLYRRPTQLVPLPLLSLSHMLASQNPIIAAAQLRRLGHLRSTLWPHTHKPWMPHASSCYQCPGI